jgi:hypothetical protein
LTRQVDTLEGTITEPVETVAMYGGTPNCGTAPRRDAWHADHTEKPHEKRDKARNSLAGLETNQRVERHQVTSKPTIEQRPLEWDSGSGAAGSWKVEYAPQYATPLLLFTRVTPVELRMMIWIA